MISIARCCVLLIVGVLLAGNGLASDMPTEKEAVVSNETANNDLPRLTVVSNPGELAEVDGTAGLLVTGGEGGGGTGRQADLSIPDSGAPQVRASVTLWDIASGRTILSVAGRYGLLSTRSGWFAVLGDYDVRFWRLDRGTSPIHRVPFAGAVRVNVAAFSNDDRLFAALDENGMVTVWSVLEGRILASLPVSRKRGLLGTQVRKIAFSANGDRLVTAGPYDSAIVWSLLDGKRLATLGGHAGQVLTADFLGQGKIATTDEQRNVRVWGEDLLPQILRTAPKESPLYNRLLIAAGEGEVIVAPIGQRGATSEITIVSPDGTTVKQLQAGWELRDIAPDGSFAILFEPSENPSFYVRRRGTYRVFDLHNGRTSCGLEGYDNDEVVAGRAAFAVRRSRSVLPDVAAPRTVAAIETRECNTMVLAQEAGRTASHSSFTLDGHAVSMDYPGKAGIWDLTEGSFHPMTDLPDTVIGSARLSLTSDRRYLLALRADNASEVLSVLAIDLSDGRPVFAKELPPFAELPRLESALGNAIYPKDAQDRARTWPLMTSLMRMGGLRALSADGLHDAIIGLKHHEIEFSGYRHSRQLVTTFAEQILFLPIDGTLAVRAQTGSVAAYDPVSGRLVHDFGPLSAHASALAVSPDGETLAVGQDDGVVSLWNSRRAEPIGVIDAGAGIVDLSLSPDGSLLVAVQADGTTSLWRLADRTLVAHLIAFQDGNWAVVAADGRFDAGDPIRLSGLAWVLPDDPRHPQAVELFMRDFYEPRLLPRLLAGEVLPPIRKGLLEVNRARPKVLLTKIEWPAPDLARVTVDVTAERSTGTDSGAFDLRLLRDGQLVAALPERGGPLPLDMVGHSSQSFEVAVPHNREDGFVLEAFAFNSDGIKSETASRRVLLQKPLPKRRGRAYVVSIGVNVFETKSWNLEFAVADAKALQAALVHRLSTGSFSDVIGITLSSQGPTTDHARKAMIKAVFDRLAGRTTDPQAIAQVPELMRLQVAAPEDLLIITMASHGDVDQSGVFYFFPSDVGPDADTAEMDELNRHAISSEELGDWIQDVRAGELVMIIDSCHSAASVGNRDFKPIPMNSRSLGQLAFLKGMRLLAASQSDQEALESEETRHGYLTYALVNDGLDAGKADWRPRDGVIRLGEWLAYGVQRVPALADDVAAGHFVRSTPLLTHSRSGPSFLARRVETQTPRLFDFNRASLDPVLEVLPPH